MSHLSSSDILFDLKKQAEMVYAWKSTFDDHQSSFQPELEETHISWVLLTKDKAYKIKKALKFDFLDFSDLSSRRFYCEEEIRLNKRTAPEIYQQVVAIGGSVACPGINAEPVMEYAVQMRRFPRENKMSLMLQDARLEVRHIDSLAKKIAHFHQNLPPLQEDEINAVYGAYEFIHNNLKNNYNELRSFFSALNSVAELRELNTLAERHFATLEKKKSLIKERRKKGFVRECHGDLHMGNIVVMNDEAVLFDSIEFAPDFRWMDVMCDLAFAFADLHHFGRSDYAWRLLNRYLEETGDYQGACLLDLFSASHALVRAKVTAIRYMQVAGEERQIHLEKSREYITLAGTLLEDRSAGILITCGLPGAGKSMFSLAALEKIGTIRIRSDIERKRHYGLKSWQSSMEMSANIYSEEASRMTYNILEKLTDMLLHAGFSVIIDAAFLRKSERSRFYQLAFNRKVPYVIVRISASLKTLLKRVTARQLSRRDPSEAGLDVLLEKQAQFEPLSLKEQQYAIEIMNEDGYDFESDDMDWEGIKRRLSIL